MLVVEVWIFIFGNIVAGTAHNLVQLVVGRLISGVGGAGLLSLCTIVISRETPPPLLPSASLIPPRTHARETEKLLPQPHQRRFHSRRLPWTNHRWQFREVGPLELDVSSAG